MSSVAWKAKNAKSRARIARNLLVRNQSGEFGRALDDCFEMYDGREVVEHLVEMVKTDVELRAACLRHWRFVPSTVYNAARTSSLVGRKCRADDAARACEDAAYNDAQ